MFNVQNVKTAQSCLGLFVTIIHLTICPIEIPVQMLSIRYCHFLYLDEEHLESARMPMPSDTTYKCVQSAPLSN